MTDTEKVVAETVVADDVLTGVLRRPVNAARNAKGSIHDDETATKLGLRGGTVAGSVHLDLFPALLREVFGQSWFERGTLSMGFKSPTTDGEPVRASLVRPRSDVDTQVRAWIDREDGMRVGEGTASVGRPTDPTALRGQDLARFDEGDYRILAGVEPGDEIPETKVSVDPAAQRALLEGGRVAEPIDWQQSDSPWGGPIAAMQTMVHHLYGPGRAFITRNLAAGGGAVGLFGAIELENLSGPMLVDRTYVVSGRILARGQSPKTEYAWFDSAADDASGKRIAEMRMLLRWMKASSQRYR